MISVGRGANESIQEQIKSLGANMLMIFSGVILSRLSHGNYNALLAVGVLDLAISSALLVKRPLGGDQLVLTEEDQCFSIKFNKISDFFK